MALDDQLFNRVVALQKTRSARDRTFGAGTLGALGDTRNGMTIADAVAAHGTPRGGTISAKDRAAMRLALLEQMQAMDKLQADAASGKAVSETERYKLQLEGLDKLIGHMAGIKSAEWGAEEGVAISKIGAASAARQKAMEISDRHAAKNQLSDPDALKSWEETYRKLAPMMRGDTGTESIDPRDNPAMWRGLAEGLSGIPEDERVAWILEMDRALGLPPGQGFGELAFDEEARGKFARGGTAIKSDIDAVGRLVGVAGRREVDEAALAEQALAEADRLDAEIKRMGVGANGDKTIQQLVGLYLKLSTGKPLDDAEYKAAIGGVTTDGEPAASAGVSTETSTTTASRGAGDAAAPAAEGEAANPTKDRMEALFEELSQPNPEPAVIAKKRAIMESMEFKTFMAKRHITDPDFAFRVLMKETKARRGDVRKQDRAAVQGDVALGKAPATTEERVAAVREAAAPSAPQSAAAEMVNGSAETGRAQPKAPGFQDADARLAAVRKKMNPGILTAGDTLLKPTDDVSEAMARVR